MKKAGKILIPAAALALALLFVLWQNGVFSQNKTGSEIGSVTLTIRCDGALRSDELKDSLRDLLPEDGVLGEAAVPLLEGDTVYTVLTRFCRENKIALDASGTTRYGIYVSGIGGLYERDCGAQSGWMFSVNGDFVQKSAGDAALRDGDDVLWVYTLDLGKDVGSDDA